MNSTTIKGTIDEAVGKAKQEAGKLTGDGKTQLEGIIQETKGKLENAWGQATDAVHNATEKTGKLAGK